MSKAWKDLWGIIKEKAKRSLFQESVWDKAGLADPVSLAIIFAGGLILGSVFGSGVNTRSIVVRVQDSKNVHIENLKVEVSGSGGVSVPITGGCK